MQERGVVPNIVACSAAVSTCEQGRQMEAAVSLPTDLQRDGPEPDVLTYTSLLSVLARGQRWPEAMESLTSMSRQRVQPNVPAYDPAISPCKRPPVGRVLCSTLATRWLQAPVLA